MFGKNMGGYSYAIDGTQQKEIVMKTKIIAAMIVAGLVGSPMAFAQDATKHSNAQHTTRTQAEKEENTGMQRPDAWVMAKVKSTFAVTSGVDATDISVSVTDGKVFLSGTVGSTAELDQAKRVAQGIEGVKSVDTSKVVVQRESTDSRK